MKIVNKSKLIAAALIAAWMPASSLAWSAITKVADVVVFNDGHVGAKFVGFSGNNACGSDWFSLGLAGSVHQKAMHATVLAALIAGKNVAVNTAPGVCNGGLEAVQYIAIQGQ